jgi:hypothetical protein
MGQNGDHWINETQEVTVPGPVYRHLAWAPRRGTFHQAVFYFAFWTIQSFKSGASSRAVTAGAVVQIAEMEQAWHVDTHFRGLQRPNKGVRIGGEVPGFWI